VIVHAGEYSETVLIQGTQTLTIVGPTASSFTGNQVNIAASAPSGVVAFNTQKSNGIVFRNINITNTISVTNAKAPAMLMSGSSMLLDTVALISGGIGVYQAGLGTTLISNSYIEGNVPEIHNEFRWTLIRFRRRQVVLHIRHGVCLQLRDRPDDRLGFHRIPPGILDWRPMVQRLIGHRLEQRPTKVGLEQHLRLPCGPERELHGSPVPQHRTRKSDRACRPSPGGVHEVPQHLLRRVRKHRRRLDECIQRCEPFSRVRSCDYCRPVARLLYRTDL
jgi:hypothetical protein